MTVRPFILRPFTRFFSDPIYRTNYIVVCSPRKRFEARVKSALEQQADASSAVRKSVLAALDVDKHGLGVQSYLSSAYGCTFRLLPEHGDGMLPFVIIWVQPGADVGVLAHEAWHGVFWVLSRRGVTFNAGDEDFAPMESVAYYLEWVVQRALGLRT